MAAQEQATAGFCFVGGLDTFSEKRFLDGD
jgi:hypothetical protein